MISPQAILKTMDLLEVLEGISSFTIQIVGEAPTVQEPQAKSSCLGIAPRAVQLKLAKPKSSLKPSN